MTTRPVLVIITAAFLASNQAIAQTRIASSSARKEIDAVNERYVAAYNRGDVAQFARVYAPDATIMPANSPPIHGQPAIGQFWQGGWKMGIRNVKLTTTELDVHGPSAIEVGRYEFDVQSAAGGPPAHDRGKYIVVWKHSATNGWQWYRDIFNSDMPAAQSGATDAPAGPKESGTRALPGDTAWIVTYNVRADKRGDYEGFIDRFWRTGLDYGTRTDPATLATFQHTRVLYPNRMNRDSTYTYMFVMDPVVAGAEYDIEKLLKRMLPADQAASEYRTFTESLAANSTNAHQFWTMRQH